MSERKMARCADTAVLSDDIRASLLKCLNTPRAYYPIISCQDMVVNFHFLIKGVEERTTTIGKATKDKLVVILIDNLFIYLLTSKFSPTGQRFTSNNNKHVEIQSSL